jgi:flagellin-like protein
MTKGISPLVASVLLIAITMAIAAILANYVSGLTRQTLGGLPTCIGGSVNYISSAYPQWDYGNSRVIGIVEAQSVPLGGFKFEILLTNSTIINSADTQGLSLAPGSSGTVISSTLPLTRAEISQVRITTNCSNARTDFDSLKN